MSYLTLEQIAEYRMQMREEERSERTMEKYMRDLNKFREYLDGQEMTKDRVISYKEYLMGSYAVSSVNSMLAAVNGFLDFAGLSQYRVKPVKQQRQVYCMEERELTKEEYYHLIRTANSRKKERLSLIMQTICSTGIRISELPFITVRAVQLGKAQVDCKGKCRQILIPRKLQKLLQMYIKRQNIISGVIFISSQGNPLNRSNIWREMKNLCREAGISDRKVFPHNLRHLFAVTYYEMEKDIAKLADLLGHSSINTTRIYIISSGSKHQRQMERLRLVL